MDRQAAQPHEILVHGGAMHASLGRRVGARCDEQRQATPLQRRTQRDQEPSNIQPAGQTIFVEEVVVRDDLQQKGRVPIPWIGIDGIMQRHRPPLTAQPCRAGREVRNPVGDYARRECPEGCALGIESVLAPPKVEHEVLLEVLNVHAGHDPLPCQPSCRGADIPHHFWV